MITITDVAAERVQHYLTGRGKGIGIRVKIITTGCSGYAYQIEFVDVLNDDDISHETKDITLVTDPKTLNLMDGTEVDFGTEGLNAGFKFNNPQVDAMCGCGESFTINK